MQLNQENMETYILLLVDGELDKKTAEQVMAMIRTDAQWTELYRLYAATVLPEEELPAFPDKESLLRTESQTLVLKRGRSYRPAWAAAAGLLLFAVLSALWLLRRPGTVMPPGGQVASRSLPSQESVAMKPAVPLPPDTARVVALVPYAAGRKSSVVPGRATAYAGREASQPLARVRAATAVTPIEVRTAQVPVPVAIAPPEARQLPAATVVASAPEEPVPLPQWLPVREENLEGVNDLLAHIQTLKNGVLATAQTLKGSRVVLRLGEKEITLGKRR